jgi:hypothetical protein
MYLLLIVVRFDRTRAVMCIGNGYGPCGGYSFNQSRTKQSYATVLDDSVVYFVSLQLFNRTDRSVKTICSSLMRSKIGT